MQKYLLLLVLSCFSFLPVLAQAEALPPGLSASCREFLRTLPAEFNYGFLQVPEDWDQPMSSPQLRIFYYFRKTTDSATPVMFFNGGPGFDNHLSATAMAGNLRLLPGVPFVFMDQRGNGCSSAYPVPQTEEELKRFRFYGSRGIVHDAEAVRHALYGNRPWKIFGQSFGAFLVHRYVTLAPEGVAAAFAHGDALTRSPLGPYYYRVLGQKRIADTYLAAHPSDRTKLLRIRGLLPPELCLTKGSFGVCGEGILDGILVTLFGAGAEDSISNMLNELLSPAGELNRPALTRLTEQFIFSIYAPDQAPALHTLNAAALVSGPAYVVTMDMVGDFNPEDPGNCRRIGEALAAQGISALPMSECRFVLAMRYTGFESLAPGPEPVTPSYQVLDRLTLDQFKDAIHRHPEIPFHLYSGEHDTFVPTEVFAEEAAELGALIHYVSFPSSAHNGYLTERKIWDDLR